MQIGPYTITGELGRGAMGVVYRARRDDLDRDFALKVLGATLGASPVLAARFQREAHAAAALAAHPGIVGVHDSGTHAGAPYLVMDFVAGRSLDQVIEAGDVAPTTAAEWVAAAARALHHAHTQGVLHRDVKPANLLLGDDGRIRVADFGLARITDTAGDLTRLTRSDQIVGTPAYMAPEQIVGFSGTGQSGLSPACDCYALGVTLYELLAGRPPFTGESTFDVLSQAMKTDAPPLTSVQPGTPRPLAAIVAQCLAKEPAGRYPDCGALADDLERFLRGEPVSAKLPGAAARVAGAAGRLRWWLAGGLLLAAAAGGVAWGWRRTAREAREVKAATEQSQAAEASLTAAQLGAQYYTRLLDACGDATTTLRDFSQRAPVDAADADAALAHVEAVVEQMLADDPGARLPNTWRAYARLLHDPTRDARTAFLAAASGPLDDPYPALLAFQFQCAEFTHTLTLPQMQASAQGIQLRPFSTPNAPGPVRARLLETLGKLASVADWQDTSQLRDFGLLTEAAHALLADKPDEAAEKLGRVTDDPILGPVARRLRGAAFFAAERFPQAAQQWEQEAGRGWLVAQRNTAVAWTAEAVMRTLRGEREAGVAAWRRAAAASQALVDRTPGAPDPAALSYLANARSRIAFDDPAIAPAQRQSAMREVADLLEQAFAGRPAGSIAASAGVAYLQLGILQARGPGEAPADPRAAFARALELFAEADRLGAEVLGPDTNPVEARWRLGQAQADRTDPQALATLVQAAREAAAVTTRHPNDATVRFLHGRVHIALSKAQVAANADPTAALEAARVALEEATRLDTTNPDIPGTLAEVHRRHAKEAQYKKLDPAPHLRAAFDAFAEMAKRYAAAGSPKLGAAYAMQGRMQLDLSGLARLRGDAAAEAAAKRAALEYYTKAVEAGAPWKGQLNQALLLEGHGEHDAAWAAVQRMRAGGVSHPLLDRLEARLKERLGK